MRHYNANTTHKESLPGKFELGYCFITYHYYKSVKELLPSLNVSEPSPTAVFLVLKSVKFNEKVCIS